MHDYADFNYIDLRIMWKIYLNPFLRMMYVLVSCVIVYPVVLNWINNIFYSNLNLQFAINTLAEVVYILIVLMLVNILASGSSVLKGAALIVLMYIITYFYSSMSDEWGPIVNFVFKKDAVGVDWIYIDNRVHLSCLMSATCVSILYNLTLKKGIDASLQAFVVIYIIFISFEVLGYLRTLQGVSGISLLILPMISFSIPTIGHERDHGVLLILFMFLVPVTYLALARYSLDDRNLVAIFVPFLYPISIYALHLLSHNLGAGHKISSLLYALFVSTGMCILLIGNTSYLYNIFDLGRHISWRNYSEYRLAFVIQLVLMVILLYRCTYPALLNGNGRLILLRKFGKTKENEHLWNSLMSKSLRQTQVITLDDGNFQSYNNSIRMYIVISIMIVAISVLFYNNMSHFILSEYGPDSPAAGFIFGSFVHGLCNAITVIGSEIVEYYLGGFIVFFIALIVSGIACVFVIMRRKNININTSQHANKYISKYLQNGYNSLLPKVSVVKVNNNLWKRFILKTQKNNMTTLVDVSVITSNMEWELDQITSYNNKYTIITCNVHLFNKMDDELKDYLVNHFEDIIFYSTYEPSSYLSAKINERLSRAAI